MVRKSVEKMQMPYKISRVVALWLDRNKMTIVGEQTLGMKETLSASLCVVATLCCDHDLFCSQTDGIVNKENMSMVHVSQVEENLIFPWAKNNGTGIAFGTFGELLQGRLEEEQQDFLVTLPIASYSYALFLADPTLQEMTVFPSEKQKSKRLADLLLEHYALSPGGRLILQSELPAGKGLASSSADLVATARALCTCFHLQMAPALLATLMCQIEPSDGVMYSGAVAFYYRQGYLHEFLGALPPPRLWVSMKEESLIRFSLIRDRKRLHLQECRNTSSYFVCFPT